MRRRGDHQPLFFRPWINANSNGLPLSRRGCDVEPDAKEPSFPKSGGLAALDPAACARWGGGHQRALYLIDDRDKHVR